MACDLLTRQQIAQLLRFLPLFEAPGRVFVSQWGGGEGTDDGGITAPYPVYADDVREFFQLASKPCWADREYVPAEAAKLLQNDALIQTATLEQVRTMLTYCVRAERFGDGSWEALLRSGRITAILQRLAVLQEGLGDSA
jgi:hypothetical protein